MKKKFITVLSIAGAATFAIAAINLSIIVPSIIQAYDTSFNITLKDNNENNFSSINNRKTLLTQREGSIGVEFENITEKPGFWAVFGENSYFKNVDALSGLKSITVTFSGDLSLDYKFFNQSGYNAKEDVALTSDVTYYFNHESPDIFVLSSFNGAEVETINLTYSCVRNNVKVDILKTEFDSYVDNHNYNLTNEYSYPTINEEDWNTNLKFTLSDDGTYYIVSDYPAGDRLHSDPTLIIPAYYKGLPVKEIAQSAPEIGAFSELNWLKNVYLPHTIERIAYGTFSLSAIENLYIDCANLEDFHGRNWVFYPSQLNHYKGMNVYFGPNVERIPARLFYPNVTEQTFKPIINNVYFDKNAKVKEIGDHAFHNVDGFDSIILPDSVERIGEFAFYYTSIEEMVLPSSLKTIANDAFAFSKIKNIKINDKLSTIGDRAFSYTSLECLDLSSTKMTVIEDECFAYATNMKQLSLPSTLVEIGQRAFKSSSLKEIVIPDNVTLIKEDAFNSCASLEKLYLGRNLEKIYEGAFGYTTNLKELVYASLNIKDFNTSNKIFINSASLNGLNMYVLDGVKSLPNNLFFATSNINQLVNINVISLPTSLTNVGENAFLGVDIARTNYRGTQKDYNEIIFEGDFTFENLDFGGRSNA